MSSIGRIQAALAAATNEVTLAAANINFDFTLVKCEAPREFQPLGDVLSRKRKQNAEFGSTHITARRLGALFNGLFPETPELLKAYGNRVSEIAHDAKKNFQSDATESIFSEHGGFDGTSIWAAATSSSSALHVQLLACMLARVWSAGEAIAVWYELVKQRRDEIGRRWEQNDVLPYATLSAATQSEISRESLAEWDASARAWLRTADRVRLKQQDQLMLLIANVNIPVNNDMAVYQSVISSWKSSLESMEKLVTGMPQATDSGPCLLALSAWHLYPDLIVLGSQTSEHEFKDPFVHPGGKLTLGLGPRGENDGVKRGVFWSLSLAHLNYYGRPPSRLGSFGIDSRKLTFHQFSQVVYGAFLTYWGSYGASSFTISRLLISIKDAFVRDATSNLNGAAIPPPIAFLDKSNGLQILTRAAAEHLDCQHYSDDLIHKLVAFGSKKATSFLQMNHPYSAPVPNLETLLKLLKGPDQRIALLRRLLSPQLDSNARSKVMIRYSMAYPEHLAYPFLAGAMTNRYITSDQRSEWQTFTTVYDGVELDDHVLLDGRLYALASAYPITEATQRPGQQSPTYTRWIPEAFSSDQTKHVNEQIRNISDYASRDLGRAWQHFSHELSSGKEATFQYLAGNSDLAGVFVVPPTTAEPPPRQYFMRNATMEDVIWCLNGDMFDMSLIGNEFSILHVPDCPCEFLNAVGLAKPDATTLRGLSEAYTVYQSLPDAVISPAVMNRPFSKANWLSPIEPWQGATRNLVKSRSLACVAYLDSGVVDVHADVMRDAFAIAFEDSIYVSMELCCDPSVIPEPYEIKRISGNIGRPGLTILVSATDPIVSDLNASDWRVCSEAEFDGRPEDFFSSTSMHLSFTDFYKPYIQSDGNRNQDAQIFIQEAVISVHNRGAWIGDIDILGSLRSPLMEIISSLPCSKEHNEVSLRRHLSLENWEDIIERRPLPSVIRAHGNWLARLAIVSMFVQTRPANIDDDSTKQIRVVPSDCCIACYLARFSEMIPYILLY